MSTPSEMILFSSLSEQLAENKARNATIEAIVKSAVSLQTTTNLDPKLPPALLTPAHISVCKITQYNTIYYLFAFSEEIVGNPKLNRHALTPEGVKVLSQIQPELAAMFASYKSVAINCPTPPMQAAVAYAEKYALESETHQGNAIQPLQQLYTVTNVDDFARIVPSATDIAALVNVLGISQRPCILEISPTAVHTTIKTQIMTQRSTGVDTADADVFVNLFAKHQVDPSNVPTKRGRGCKKQKK